MILDVIFINDKSHEKAFVDVIDFYRSHRIVPFPSCKTSIIIRR